MKNKTAKYKVIIQSAIFIVIIFFGVMAFKALVSFKKPPAQRPNEVVSPLVNAEKVSREDIQMIVEGDGTVKPRIEVQLVPQVSGEVVRVDEDFVNGGFFVAGQELVKIDPSDYKLALESAQATVAAAEVSLEKEIAEAEVATREWRKLNPGREPDSALVFRDPQIKQARAGLNSAKAQLARAKLDLERTTISVPFNGCVSSESVDLGQFLTVGSPIGTVYGTDVLEIVVPLEDTQLQWFSVPGNNNPDDDLTSAVVRVDFAGKKIKKDAKVVRTEGKIDTNSRMVNVVVQIEDAIDSNWHNSSLVPGMFVEVLIMGRKINAVRIPHYAFHPPHNVWVYDEGSLSVRQVKAARRDSDYVYITEGLADGDVVVTSPLDTVVDGMSIRVDLQEKGGDEDAAAGGLNDGRGNE